MDPDGGAGASARRADGGHRQRAVHRRPRDPGGAVRILDHLPIGVLAVIAACGSFSHIAHLAERSGQDGWMSYAVAVCVDALAVVASLEIRRDKRMGKRSTVPRWCWRVASCSPWQPTSPRPSPPSGGASARASRRVPSCWRWP
ncbi:DUF2637 domain-containing protein [Actinomadura meridiana]|uniref:DUF2637 domain-containing protein n=1 Tax=Actinomadura meridiana TaxID=559626 RepID=UPI0031E57B73